MLHAHYGAGREASADIAGLQLESGEAGHVLAEVE
jgi:hypothetical protein